MNSDIKISIITISYNNLEGLKKTVSSVIQQTWQEFEYIVIDGGSTDGSKEYLESHNDIIEHWVSEPDNGIYNAMNKGINKATGEYLLFLNSGDYFHDVNILRDNHHFLSTYDLICFDMVVLGEDLKTITSKPDVLRFSDLYLGTIPHQATFINRKLFISVGNYDENLEIVSDWKFFILALFKFHCSYKKINRTLSVFHFDGISADVNNKGKMRNERREVLEQYFASYLADYEVFGLSNYNAILLQTNRFKMLREIENTTFGKKTVSLFFRLYLILFSKKKLKDIVN